MFFLNNCCVFCLLIYVTAVVQARHTQRDFTLNCSSYEAAGKMFNYQATQLDVKTDSFNNSFVAVSVLNDSRVCNSSQFAVDVSIVTHLSIDRRYLLQPMAQHWQGPIVFVIYNPRKFSFSPLLKFINASRTLQPRTNIQYITVYRRQNDEHLLYPTNILRNIALRAARTKYVLILDVDFIPNVGMYDSLVQQIPVFSEQDRLSNNKTVFVIPAFETTSNNTFEALRHLPSNKADFVAAWLRDSKYRVFSERIFKKGHGPTNSSQWANTTVPYSVAWKPGYEPYIVADACQLPLFDERFLTADDKVTYFYMLEADGFRFVVLPTDFLIHIPHLRRWTNYKSRELDCPCFISAEQEFFKEIGFGWRDYSFCDIRLSSA